MCAMMGGVYLCTILSLSASEKLASIQLMSFLNKVEEACKHSFSDNRNISVVDDRVVFFSV